MLFFSKKQDPHPISIHADTLFGGQKKNIRNAFLLVVFWKTKLEMVII